MAYRPRALGCHGTTANHPAMVSDERLLQRHLLALSTGIAVRCGVVWCAEGAITRRQWSGCLPTGTGKREGCVSKCALCARVLLYSRDQCTVALGRCCSADACACSHRVYWAHYTLCAALHYHYFVCSAALLGAVHCIALCVPCCTALVGSE